MTKIPIASAEIWHKINLLEIFYFCYFFAEDITIYSYGFSKCLG